MTPDELSVWKATLIDCVAKNRIPPYPAHSFCAQPILIVAGSCREETGDGWESFVATLEKKLEHFSGRVICGGTLAGVCREVGRLSAEKPASTRRWRSVGYLPRNTAEDLIDHRYDQLIFTSGKTFSEIEPLQYWTDIISSSVAIEQVTFLRFGGGSISDYEEKLASCFLRNGRPINQIPQ